MSRLGYVIAACIMFGLVYFVFFTEDQEHPVYIFPEPLTPPFSLHSDVGHQVHDGTDLFVDGVKRPTNFGRVKNLAKFLKRTRVPGKQIIHEVNPADLSDYGLDGQYELEYSDQRYRWSIENGTGYIWHEQEERIYIIDKRAIETLNDSYAGRLDQHKLMNIRGLVVGIQFDDLTLERVSEVGGWLASNQVFRPAFTSRGAELLRVLRSFTLDAVRGVELPEGSNIAWDIKLDIARKSGEQDQMLVQFIEAGLDAFIKIADQPIQRVDREIWKNLKLLKDSFDQDYLLDIPMALDGLPFDRFIVRKGGKELYRVQRYGTEDQYYGIPGYSYWELIWPGGRESAAPDSGMYMFDLLNNLLVTDVRLVPDSANPNLSDDVIELACYQGEKEQKAITYWYPNGSIRSLFHRASLVADRDGPKLSYEMLSKPASFLNPYLIPTAVERIEKIQRIQYRPAFKGELLHKISAQQWRFDTYDAPGSLKRSEDGAAMACNRIAQSIALMQARETRFVKPEDIKRFEQSTHAFDIQLAAWAIESGEDDQFLEETLARDWGMRLLKEDEHWLAMNRDETLIYELTDEDVSALFAAVVPGYLLATVPNNIQQLRLKGQNEQFVLHRDGQTWRSQVKGGWRTCDALQIRQYLKNLSSCQAIRIDNEARPISTEQSIFEIMVFVPGLEGRIDELGILIGAKKDGAYPCSFKATSGLQIIEGIAWYAAADIEAIMQEQQWFLPVQETATP